MYLMPDTEVCRLSVGSKILSGSNVEDLNKSSYGSRGIAEDDVDHFWD